MDAIKHHTLGECAANASLEKSIHENTNSIDIWS